MPSGYTAALYEDEQAFNDFVMGCARGMGAAILMRDTGSDVPITLDAIQETDTYNTERLALAKTGLAETETWTDEEAAAASRTHYEKQVALWDAADAKNRALLDRYDTMLRRVQDWTPPTPDHEGLKTLMIEQLEQSIKFDCGSSWRLGEPLTGPEYREQRLAHWHKEIAYHESEIAKKAERNAGRVEWATTLFESLGLKVT